MLDQVAAAAKSQVPHGPDVIGRDDGHATELAAARGRGDATTLQAVPLKCSISGLATTSPRLSLETVLPMAQTLLVAAAATPLSVEPFGPGLGVATVVQLVPLKCSASVTSPPELNG